MPQQLFVKLSLVIVSVGLHFSLNMCSSALWRPMPVDIPLLLSSNESTELRIAPITHTVLQASITNTTSLICYNATHVIRKHIKQADVFLIGKTQEDWTCLTKCE